MSRRLSTFSRGHLRSARTPAQLPPGYVRSAQVSRYLTPAVKAIAREEGIELCEIDPARPLHEQGDFDAILHKLPPNPGKHKRAAGTSAHTSPRRGDLPLPAPQPAPTALSQTPC